MEYLIKCACNCLRNSTVRGLFATPKLLYLYLSFLCTLSIPVSTHPRQFGVSGGAGDTAGVENGEEIEVAEGWVVFCRVECLELRARAAWARKFCLFLVARGILLLLVDRIDNFWSKSTVENQISAAPNFWKSAESILPLWLCYTATIQM